MKLVIKTILKYGWYVLFTLLVLAIGVQLYLLKGTPMQSLDEKHLRSDTNYSNVPTILISGQGGNTLSFDTLIRRCQKQNIAQNAMIIRVSPTGQVHVRGSLKGKKNPLIQLLYDWNYNISFKPQERQLVQVFYVLRYQYHVKKLNVIAHSYGGTEFIHAYLGHPRLQKLIDFQKIVLLGVPVEESFGVNTKYTAKLFEKSRDAEFKQLMEQIKTANLQSTDHVYNIMGKEADEATDGEVPNIQSQMMETLFSNTKVQYSQRWYHGTTHRELHEKPAILDYIMQVLWQK